MQMRSENVAEYQAAYGWKGDRNGNVERSKFWAFIPA